MSEGQPRSVRLMMQANALSTLTFMQNGEAQLNAQGRL